MMSIYKSHLPTDEAHAVFKRWTGRHARADSTVHSYLVKTRRHLAEYAAAIHPGKDTADPLRDLSREELMAFPRWFAERYAQTAWSHGNLMTTKSALLYVLRRTLPSSCLAPIENFRPATVSRKGSQGASLREKNPTRPQMDKVTAWLEERGHPGSLLAAAWLKATRVTGLRPKEWRHAVWVDDPAGGTLAVVNGKQNAFLAQGTGHVRHLLFPGEENATSRDCVKRFLNMFNDAITRMTARGLSAEAAYARLLKYTGRWLRAANKHLRNGRPPSLAEKNICLYSGRDAFKADSVNLLDDSPESRRSIAALMGHGSIESQNYYAPDNVSTGRVGMPLALECEKARVRTDSPRRSRGWRGRTPAKSFCRQSSKPH